MIFWGHAVKTKAHWFVGEIAADWSRPPTSIGQQGWSELAKWSYNPYLTSRSLTRLPSPPDAEMTEEEDYNNVSTHLAMVPSSHSHQSGHHVIASRCRNPTRIDFIRSDDNIWSMVWEVLSNRSTLSNLSTSWIPLPLPKGIGSTTP